MFALALLAHAAAAGTIVGSKHDLYTVWYNGPHSSSLNQYAEVCVYCHTPHQGNSDAAMDGVPLWNRVTPSSSYTLYSSPTLDSSPGSPGGYSLACLSCHDGTLAVDRVVNAPGSGPNLTGPWASTVGPWFSFNEAKDHWVLGPTGGSDPACGFCHDGDPAHQQAHAFIGTDLSDDHPVSLTYPTSSVDPAFNTPPDPTEGWSDVPLFAGRVECPTCHDPHDPDRAPFLRVDNSGSALCLTCHVK